MFNQLMTDKVTLVKNNGSRYENIRLYVNNFYGDVSHSQIQQHTKKSEQKK